MVASPVDALVAEEAAEQATAAEAPEQAQPCLLDAVAYADEHARNAFCRELGQGLLPLARTCKLGRSLLAEGRLAAAPLHLDARMVSAGNARTAWEPRVRGLLACAARSARVGSVAVSCADAPTPQTQVEYLLAPLHEAADRGVRLPHITSVALHLAVSDALLHAHARATAANWVAQQRAAHAAALAAVATEAAAKEAAADADAAAAAAADPSTSSSASSSAPAPAFAARAAAAAGAAAAQLHACCSAAAAATAVSGGGCRTLPASRLSDDAFMSDFVRELEKCLSNRLRHEMPRQAPTPALALSLGRLFPNLAHLKLTGQRWSPLTTSDAAAATAAAAAAAAALAAAMGGPAGAGAAAPAPGAPPPEPPPRPTSFAGGLAAAAPRLVHLEVGAGLLSGWQGAGALAGLAGLRELTVHHEGGDGRSEWSSSSSRSYSQLSRLTSLHLAGGRHCVEALLAGDLLPPHLARLSLSDCTVSVPTRARAPAPRPLAAAAPRATPAAVAARMGLGGVLGALVPGPMLGGGARGGGGGGGGGAGGGGGGPGEPQEGGLALLLGHTLWGRFGGDARSDRLGGGGGGGGGGWADGGGGGGGAAAAAAPCTRPAQVYVGRMCLDKHARCLSLSAVLDDYQLLRVVQLATAPPPPPPPPPPLAPVHLAAQAGLLLPPPPPPQAAPGHARAASSVSGAAAASAASGGAPPLPLPPWTVCLGRLHVCGDLRGGGAPERDAHWQALSTLVGEHRLAVSQLSAPLCVAPKRLGVLLLRMAAPLQRLDLRAPEPVQQHPLQQAQQHPQQHPQQQAPGASRDCSHAEGAAAGASTAAAAAAYTSEACEPGAGASTSASAAAAAATAPCTGAGPSTSAASSTAASTAAPPEPSAGPSTSAAATAAPEPGAGPSAAAASCSSSGASTSAPAASTSAAPTSAASAAAAAAAVAVSSALAEALRGLAPVLERAAPVARLPGALRLVIDDAPGALAGPSEGPGAAVRPAGEGSGCGAAALRAALRAWPRLAALVEEEEV